METTHSQNQADLDLLKRTAGGDGEAFESLYKRFESRLFHYLRLMVQDEMMAEDILVEVMVVVWKDAVKFQGGSQVSTWIFGIARHKALDALRGRASKDSMALNLEEAAEIPDPIVNPAVDAEKSLTGEMLKKAISALSSDHQEVIYLAFYEGLNYQEISSLMSIPVNTVKTRVYYAKQKLKQVLGSLGFEENPL